MDDSLLYTGHGPVQSKSMQYIDTQMKSSFVR